MFEGVKGQTQWHSSEDFLLLPEAQCADWFLWSLLSFRPFVSSGSFGFLQFLWFLWALQFLCFLWLLWVFGFLQFLWFLWFLWTLWFLWFNSILFIEPSIDQGLLLTQPEPDAAFMSCCTPHVLHLQNSSCGCRVFLCVLWVGAALVQFDLNRLNIYCLL